MYSLSVYVSILVEEEKKKKVWNYTTNDDTISRIVSNCFSSFLFLFQYVHENDSILFTKMNHTSMYFSSNNNYHSSSKMRRNPPTY